ncbi:hypothetical protein FIBSPDRAFT_881077 [Athelia psychrophila]|uniref:Uncharacterized protein n=1 Tax=Athelia psychrophila TaxID=1759441 RepID=A0A166X9K1_9AGAM|nr:hypothetical protein FIBSPDRAFT_881077 [Fibularhizoctonia sp. CBS 109695]
MSELQPYPKFFQHCQQYQCEGQVLIKFIAINPSLQGSIVWSMSGEWEKDNNLEVKRKLERKAKARETLREKGIRFFLGLHDNPKKAQTHYIWVIVQWAPNERGFHELCLQKRSMLKLKSNLRSETFEHCEHAQRKGQVLLKFVVVNSSLETSVVWLPSGAWEKNNSLKLKHKLEQKCLAAGHSMVEKFYNTMLDQGYSRTRAQGILDELGLHRSSIEDSYYNEEEEEEGQIRIKCGAGPSPMIRMQKFHQKLKELAAKHFRSSLRSNFKLFLLFHGLESDHAAEVVMEFMIGFNTDIGCIFKRTILNALVSGSHSTTFTSFLMMSNPSKFHAYSGFFFNLHDNPKNTQTHFMFVMVEWVPDTRAFKIVCLKIQPMSVLKPIFESARHAVGDGPVPLLQDQKTTWCRIIKDTSDLGVSEELKPTLQLSAGRSRLEGLWVIKKEQQISNIKRDGAAK